VFVVGGVHDTVALMVEVAAALTMMLNAGSEDVALPSLTLMTMLEYVPTLAACGVPASWPVLVFKIAQDGPLLTENVSVEPLAPLAVGAKLYCLPAVIAVGGEPLIVGPALLPPPDGAAAVTWIENEGSDAVDVPSLTEMTTPE
jgi:hypothetical protein